MKSTPDRVIWVQDGAPLKPAPGQPCNGCGVCCLAEPCPLGVWISRSRSGPCRALVWDSAAASYRCGVLLRASEPVSGLRRLWAAGLQRWVRRWIAAGMGCDCTLEPQKPYPHRRPHTDTDTRPGRPGGAADAAPPH